MQLDLPTISAVNITVTAILGVVLLLTWARERESPLIGWWGLALLIQAAGLAMMPVLFSANLPLAVAGALIILGEGLKWKAAREFVHGRAHSFWILLGPAGFLLAAQSGLLPSFEHRLNALFATLALYSFATAFQFAQAGSIRPASRWPAVILLAILGFCYLSWLPLNLAIPIQESRWVAASIWFPLVILVALLLRVALACVVLTLAEERGAMERRADALTDALTGLPNRRALFEAADAFGQDRDLEGGAISVLIFDLDHFKQTNDRYGHALGDRVLKLFATTVRTHLDGRGIVARLGGEEFAAILPGVDQPGAVENGEAVRRAFANSGAFVDSCGWRHGQRRCRFGRGRGQRPQRAVSPRRRRALCRQACRAQPCGVWTRERGFAARCQDFTARHRSQALGRRRLHLKVVQVQARDRAQKRSVSVSVAAWLGVGLDAAAHPSRLIFKPPDRGIEGVTDRDIDVLMGLVDGLGPVDDHVLPRHADIDPHAVELALMMMAVRRLDHDGAADDAVVEAFELRRFLANALLDGGGGVHIPKADLQRYRHRRANS